MAAPAIAHPSATGVTPFVIYEDAEAREPTSPSDVYEGDMPLSLGRPLSLGDNTSTIELEQELSDEPLPYRSSYTSRKSISKPRRSSAATHFSLISAIPSETSISSKPIPPASPGIDTRYAPQKDRPRFRNPESVRAMQMSSPPPLLDHEASRERMKGAYKIGTPTRSETPVSRRSGSRRGSVRDQHSPRPAPAPQQAPLVLLHVTILPMQVPFSHDLMVRIMPDWLVENYKLLEDKLQDIILMRRGLLIPHPRDEYDLLEERILESLELKTPRLLKCGHFVAPDDDSDKESDDGSSSSSSSSSSASATGSTGRGRRMSGGTLTEEDKWGEHLNHTEDSSVCCDCNRELKRPGKGVGAGSRRWDIKIYAANGLMRSAAWSACWNDMERCDVEISPWIPEEVRKILERRAQEEQEAEKRKQMYAIELQRQIQEAAVKQRILEEDATEIKRQEEVEKYKKAEATAAAALEKSIEEQVAERKRLEEVMEGKIMEAKEVVRLELEAKAQAEAKTIAERFSALEAAIKEQKKAEPTTAPRRRTSSMGTKPSISSRPSTADIPLSTLLKNYILVLLGDQRNVIIFVLSITVIFLSLNMNGSGKQPLTISSEKVAPIHPKPAVTTTAFSTLTVTQVQTAVIGQSTAATVLEFKNTVAQAVGSQAICEPEAVFQISNLFCPKNGS